MSNDQDDMIKAFAEDAQDVLNEWERACLRIAEQPIGETMRVLLRCAHNLKGNAGLIGFTHLSEAVHRLEDRLIEISKLEIKTDDSQLMGILFEIEKFLRTWINHLISDPKFTPDNFNVLAKIESWPSHEEESTATGPSGRDNLPAFKPSFEKEVVSALQAAETIRIPSNKLDGLIQLVGELSLAQAIVARGSQEGTLNSTQVKEAIALCDKISQSLRTVVLDLRMLPMGGLYQRLERAGMEISVRLKKPIQFLTEGADVSLDKAVLHRIFDPLLHMIRNAIDHGLETPDERKLKGKPPTGTVKVISEIGARGVVIKITDDGRGLDKERILKKAIDKNLATEGQNLSDKNIFDFIFSPGFSTAEVVTDISGRGVGMDVVMREVVSLGGVIDVESTPGQGSVFQITLPTNISLIDVLVVRVNGILYGVPTQDVTEILDLLDYKIETSSAFKQMINYRKKVMPIENLSRFLPNQSNEAPSASDEQKGCILVVQHQSEQLGFKIDTIEGQQQVFIRPLKGYMSKLPWLTGSTILSNGEPSLIINLKEVTKDFGNGTRKGQQLGESTL